MICYITDTMDAFVEFIKPYSDLLQAVSFIATIALTAISILGLKQLAIAKNALNTQSLRDARRLSSDHIYRYLDRVLNFKWKRLGTDQITFIKNYRYSKTDKDNLDVKEIMKLDPSVELKSRKDREKYIKNLKDAVSPFIDLLNELEAFSAVVTSGVVDEYTVYRAVGQNFVNKIQNNHLEEVLQFYNQHENLYTNLLEVYQLWDTRSVVKKTEAGLKTLEKQSNETAKKIQSLKERVSKIQTKTINSIGVSEKGK